MRSLPLAAAFIAVLAASGAAAPVAHADELPAYAVTLKDGRIEPARLEVPAGRRIKLTLRNEGPGAAEFEGRNVRVEKVLAPGAVSFVVIQPLKPGTYRFFDEFHPNAPDMELVAK
ncbi:MAG: cupredoxin domain-containing protein [Proteobacteria bacterium]|nr:cupredoxin domain-containing protein [Pseudomonadota bacterium]